MKRVAVFVGAWAGSVLWLLFVVAIGNSYEAQPLVQSYGIQIRALLWGVLVAALIGGSVGLLAVVRRRPSSV